MSSEAIKIAITDDHPIVINGIVDLLNTEEQFQIVGKYENAKETLAQIENDQAQILLLDINLPDISGLE